MLRRVKDYVRMINRRDGTFWRFLKTTNFGSGSFFVSNLEKKMNFSDQNKKKHTQARVFSRKSHNPIFNQILKKMIKKFSSFCLYYFQNFIYPQALNLIFLFKMFRIAEKDFFLFLFRFLYDNSCSSYFWNVNYQSSWNIFSVFARDFFFLRGTKQVDIEPLVTLYLE